MQFNNRFYTNHGRQNAKNTIALSIKILKNPESLQALKKNSQPSFFSYSRAFLGVLFFAAALLCAAECPAENLTFAWSASTEPVAGYTIFYGEQSVLANPAAALTADTGKVLQYTIAGLTAGKKYFFAVKAFNVYGQSNFSNEVSATIPAASTTTTTAPSTSTTIQSSTTTTAASTTSTIAIVNDSDQDGIADIGDNCPYDYNPEQLDADDDGIGDVCDPSPGCGGCGQADCELYYDTDQDGISDAIDNCPDIYNPLQLDANENGIGDCCDPSPGCGGCGQPDCDIDCEW